MRCCRQSPIRSSRGKEGKVPVFLALLFCCTFMLPHGRCIRVRENIYVDLTNKYPCFRMLNGTAQVGCQSTNTGNVGVVQLIEKIDDMRYVFDDPNSFGPFMLVMKLTIFKQMVRLKDDERFYAKVSGIILINENYTSSVEYSDDVTCPAERSSMYASDPEYAHCRKVEWNEPGTGYNFISWNIPITLVTNTSEIDMIVNKCYMKYNEVTDNGKAVRWPLCALQLSMFNLAAGNAQMCLYRTTNSNNIEGRTYFCGPLDDYNVYAFIPQTNNSQPLTNDSVFVLASRMDSFSMFADMSPGADSAISNVVVMLGLIEALSRAKATISRLSERNGKHLLLAFFHGESLDYIGSSRMVWDMQSFRFPHPLNNTAQTSNQPALFNLSHIGFFLELNQLALSMDGHLFLHADPLSLAFADVRRTVENAASKLVRYDEHTFITFDRSLPLPPASLQSFLKVRPDIPGLVITDHVAAFSNKFYNSFLDQPPVINQQKFVRTVKHAGDAILRLVFNWLNDSVEPAAAETPQIDTHMVETLVGCLLRFPDWNCSALRRIVNSLPNNNDRQMAHMELDGYPMHRTYIGIRPDMYASLIRLFATYFSSYFLGQVVDQEKCHQLDDNEQVTDTMVVFRSMANPFDEDDNQTYCFASSVMTSIARSPAFDIEGYNFASGKYSTWVESIWAIPKMRIFLMSSASWQYTVFGIGLIVFLLSLFVTYVIASGADVLFASSVSDV